MAITADMTWTEMFHEMSRLVHTKDPETSLLDHTVDGQRYIAFINNTEERYTMLAIAIDEDGCIHHLDSGLHRLRSFDKATVDLQSIISTKH